MPIPPDRSAMAQLYCKPILELGTGLGNRLFPWARCLLFARGRGAAMIDPIWLRPAIGALQRGGIDYRSYFRQLVLFGLFQRHPANLSPLAGLVKSRGARRIAERDADGSALDRKVLVLFQGFEGFFAPLAGHQGLLRREIRAITRDRYVRIVDAAGEIAIGICVRCGNDYAEPRIHDYGPLGSNEKTPLRWYVETLRLIRGEAGGAAPAFVVSDGRREMLRPLLELENVTFVRPGSAISDLLILAKAKVLLAPGASSFAAWASFLGEMPSATHPGQPLSVWRLPAARGQFLGEIDPTRPDRDFLRQAAEAIDGRGSRAAPRIR